VSWQWASSLNRSDKVKFAVSFALLGVLVGAFIGIYEGVFILIHQRHLRLIEAAVGPAILLLAPLVDALGYGFLGGMLGVAAALCHQKFPGRTAYFVAIGLAIPSTHLTFVAAHEWIRIPPYSHVVDAGLALVAGLIVGGATLQYWPIILPHGIAWHARLWPLSRSVSRQCVPFTGVVLIGLATVVISMTLHGRGSRVEPEPLRAAGNLPNIVMIALDTARADHLSAYGYTSPTTPNLDKLAEQGVLFETAAAPAPWTLPSFATVFTGLLPHQNAAASETPLAHGTSTLASILGSRGYQTAGFNANPSYGTRRAGIAQGFEVYDDDDRTLRSDLASIDLAKAFWSFVYYPFIRPQNLPRRDARALNQAVFRWFRHGSAPPYLLFVNYI